jgi:hypothetical protein
MTSILRNSLLAQTLIWLCLTPCGAGGLPGPGTSQPPTGDFASDPWQVPVKAPQQNPPLLEPETTPRLSPKQKREIAKSRFEKMKQDADDLAALAKSLQEELDKSNENVFSLHVVEKAEKIEKLARKIKGEAKGY